MDLGEGFTLDIQINNRLDIDSIPVADAQKYIDELTPYLQFEGYEGSFQYTISRLKALKKRGLKPEVKPNLAEKNSVNKEVNAPYAKNQNDNPAFTTFPPISAGIVTGTGVDASNNDLAHICDFSTDALKNTKLAKFLKAQANNIRDAIRSVMRLLGFSDATGTFQWLKDSLQAITRALKYLQKNVIQPIIDFENIVIGYVAKLKAIIAYILSLPAKILALLQDCLTKLYKAIANVFDDIKPSGLGGAFSEIIATAKETAATFTQTVSLASTAVGTAAAAATAVSSIPNLVTPLKKGP
jgi:hypothetical protein